MAATSASVAPSGMPGQETLATHFRKIVNDCHELDCGFIRIGMLPMDCMGSLEKVLHFCKMANAAAKKLSEEGIKLYYHNHHIEFRKFNGVTMLDIIRENAPLLGFELDVHWIHRGGYDPVRIIRKYAGSVDLIHLKDYRIGALSEEVLAAPSKGDFDTFLNGFKNAVQFAEVGEGSLDMEAIIEASLESGAKYFFIEQDELYGRDVFDCLATSRDNLRRLGYELT
jgi:sugar phosphate isomerase/epimerase